jgi:hypothetical protein
MTHVPIMFLSKWRKFPSASCLAGKKPVESTRLNVVEIAGLLLAFRHINRTLFQTTVCIQSYDFVKYMALGSHYPLKRFGLKKTAVEQAETRS